jgi:ABC-type polar amino acid transport system ATPase subunit
MHLSWRYISLVSTKCRGLPADKLTLAVSEAVREVDLVDKFQEEVQSLSGGQKRRLSLALAFIVRPIIVFIFKKQVVVNPIVVFFVLHNIFFFVSQMCMALYIYIYTMK